MASGASPFASVRQSGFALGVVGAVLDFYVGYLILQGSSTNDMGMVVIQSGSALAWGVGLFILGGLLILTALASVTSLGTGRGKSFGALMVVYGVVMLAIGGFMYSGFAPMMGGALLSSLGMILLGALMVLNGAVMRMTHVKM
jgi:hypothetical protein